MAKDVELDPDYAEDARIFHYTSAPGLYGILEGKCLWATHFQFLNDSKEFYAARESLIQFVQKAIHKQLATWKVNRQFEFQAAVDLADLAAHEATTIVDSMYQTTYERVGSPFIFSGFCCTPDHRAYQNGGLLHWATYGQRGGYALRLNPHKLQTLLKAEHERFSELTYRSATVVYSSDAPDGKFKADYETIANTARSMVEGMVKNNFENVDIAASADPFWRISSMLKDDYFRDESEARIVAMLMNNGRPDTPRHTIHVRHREGISIPYIKLFENTLLGEDCPIEAVIVGPHHEKEKRLRALEIFIKFANLGSIEIIKSDVPYIG